MRRGQSPYDRFDPQTLGRARCQARVWCAIPKVVFSRTLDRVQGNARLAEVSLAEEIAAALDATDKDVSIGGAGLAAAAIGLGEDVRLARDLRALPARPTIRVVARIVRSTVANGSALAGDNNASG